MRLWTEAILALNPEHSTACRISKNFIHEVKVKFVYCFCHWFSTGRSSSIRVKPRIYCEAIFKTSSFFVFSSTVGTTCFSLRNASLRTTNLRRSLPLALMRRWFDLSIPWSADDLFIRCAVSFFKLSLAVTLVVWQATSFFFTFKIPYSSETRTSSEFPLQTGLWHWDNVKIRWSKNVCALSRRNVLCDKNKFVCVKPRSCNKQSLL